MTARERAIDALHAPPDPRYPRYIVARIESTGLRIVDAAQLSRVLRALWRRGDRAREQVRAWQRAFDQVVDAKRAMVEERDESVRQYGLLAKRMIKNGEERDAELSSVLAQRDAAERLCVRLWDETSSCDEACTEAWPNLDESQPCADCGCLDDCRAIAAMRKRHGQGGVR